jgi:hypothetical protein
MMVKTQVEELQLEAAAGMPKLMVLPGVRGIARAVVEVVRRVDG